MTQDNFEDDIPLQAAMDAHRGTSFVPEKRAEQERADYARIMGADRSELEALADTPEKRDLLAAEFARYREGMRRRTVEYLQARSRCVSTMIAGPARFPTERMRKRGDAADRRSQELLEFRERAVRAIRKKLCPTEGPIMSGDADAVARLEAKIAEAEAARERIKRENAEARKAGKYQHPAYELTNLGANIRRMKERKEHLARTQAVPATTAQGTAARIEDAPAENRIRLFFPGKPAAEVRDRLKRAAFRWSPTVGAWSAYRTPHTLDVAAEIAGTKPTQADERKE